MVKSKHDGGNRDSSLELFRIVVMLMIIAHHYVVNSGVLKEITQSNVMDWNSIFCLWFGFGGKTGINCFVLITGYFMCKSRISLKKYIKILFEIIFYRLGFFCVFYFTGYTDFSVINFWKALFPYWNIGDHFAGSYLVFFLFIPFINLFINNITERNHALVIMAGVCFNTILPTFFGTKPMSTYVGWFMLLYLIASYIRLYPKRVFESSKIWGIALFFSWALTWTSIYVMAFVYQRKGIGEFYYFVSDVNKIFAVTIAVCAFLFFKNLHMKYHPTINKFAASAFGVLLVHANSDSMRKWLWKDVLKNTEVFYKDYLIVHAFISIVMIYLIASLIDMLRIRFVEQPLLKFYDKWNIEGKLINWWNKRVSK